MIHKQVDINADVGEGVGNESYIMPYISSCNIACGGHAGDFKTMSTVVKLAKQHHVKIGAHPSFPDKENFGRRKIEMSSASLYTSLKHQINDLLKVIRLENTSLNHIKPHGALYNDASINEKTAMVIIEVIKSMELPVTLYVPYQSVISRLAKENNLKITYEAFADRNYNNDLTLMSRRFKNAVIKDADTVFKHVYDIITKEKVKSITGNEIDILADTICIHGDNPEAIDLIKYLRSNLERNGIIIC